MAQLTKQEKLELKKAKKAARKQQKREKRAAFAEDFKKFLFRGNVIDLAVGVVVGGAFSKIVTSFTNGIVMPLVGKLMGKVSLADLKWVLTPAVYEEGTEIVVEPEVAVLYGQFLQNIVDFLVIATCIFVAVRIITSVRMRIVKAREALQEAIEKEIAEREAANAPVEEVVEEVVPVVEEPVVEEPAAPSVEEQTLAVLQEIKELLAKHE